MKVKNISNQQVFMPGTQPGYFFEFQPGEVKDIPDDLSGIVKQTQGLIIDAHTEQVVEQPQVSEGQPRTIKCSICNKEIKSKNEKFDSRLLKMHIAKFHKQ